MFNRISTYAIQAAERLPVEATHMLIAGAIDFVVFIEKRNEYARGGRLRRFVNSVREVTGVDGRVLSSEVFAPGPDGHAVPHAPVSCVQGPDAARLRPRRREVGMSGSGLYPLLGIVAGAVAGGGIFLLVVAIRGVPARPKSDRGRGSWSRRCGTWPGCAGPSRWSLGALTLLATRWVVAAIGVALLALGWRSLGGASSERRAIARLEGLAAWTESLRDTIAGAVGLEQAIPSSLRAAAPSLQEPLTRLVDRLHTRMPMPDALRRFADDLDDPGADLIIAALIINARLRGPGLRDLLGGLSTSVREELDMRRKINAERRATRRSVQIVVLVAVAVALALGHLQPRLRQDLRRPARPDRADRGGRLLRARASSGCASWPASTRPSGCCLSR